MDLGIDRGSVDRVANDAAHQHVANLLSHLQGDVGLGFLGGSGQVRRAYHAVVAQEIHEGRRLLLEDV